ncbi:cytochrome b5 domain-containing protein 1 [Spea bombifrons]|uniref:cytochrome b5 domain-containing protein 1 n=1 Tax=Spea bombifrons TaxID=233779 RepID=UPI00234AE6AC|nr:cytochrome b5 domain-containing protein 1 [Spea bombifrons]
MVPAIAGSADMTVPPRRPFYTPREVSRHCTLTDLWVSYLGKVYDLTPLAKQHKGDVLLKPIIAAAGKDISHWFNPKTGDIKTYIDPQTGCLKYYTPQGRFIHVPPSYPSTDWDNSFGRPWWRDPSYEIGILSSKTRFIRIINTLTSQEHTLEVCSEENMWEILHRYLPCNAHATSYTWKFDGVPLDMDKTLQENGVRDEDEEFEQLTIDSDLFTPSILLYFNDDLTEY